MRQEEQRQTKGLLVVLSGPSGVGKGAVAARAMSSRGVAARRLRRSVSLTTRPRRPDEREGRDYFFCTPEEFERRAATGGLLERATYLDSSYGTPVDPVDKQLGEGYDVVLEIEVQGAMQVRERRPDAVLIYMLPPSWNALRRRLKSRRSECERTQLRRLQVAREEIKYLPQYDYVVVNERVARAARTLLAITEAERARVARADLSMQFADLWRSPAQGGGPNAGDSWP
jgi:guanylate kinase